MNEQKPREDGASILAWLTIVGLILIVGGIFGAGFWTGRATATYFGLTAYQGAAGIPKIGEGTWETGTSTGACPDYAPTVIIIRRLIQLGLLSSFYTDVIAYSTVATQSKT